MSDNLDLFTTERIIRGEQIDSDISALLDTLRGPHGNHTDNTLGEAVVLALYRSNHRTGRFRSLATSRAVVAAGIIAVLVAGSLTAGIQGVVPNDVSQDIAGALAKTQPAEPVEPTNHMQVVLPGVGEISYQIVDGVPIIKASRGLDPYKSSHTESTATFTDGTHSLTWQITEVPSADTTTTNPGAP